MPEIQLPHNWSPMQHQIPLLNYLQSGGKRAVCVWHRRSGKDMTSLHWTVQASMQRPGTYWHMFPTMVQGRRAIWNGSDNEGNRFLTAIPGWREYEYQGNKNAGIVKHIRNDEMRIEFINGSMWQVVGSDNYDYLVGTNPVGVIFSEYSIADPAAWDYLRPILLRNGGWAIFIFTPRGHNHGLKILDMARGNDKWFSEVLTIDETGLLTEEEIQEERDSGMSEAMIKQEYYCSFDSPLEGAFYAEELMKVTDEKRICHVPHDRNVRVETWWDLGIGDATSIWFAQRVGHEIHLIDYYENVDKPLHHYVNILEEKRQEHGYKYSDHVFPHDVRAREFISGKSREEVLKGLGMAPKVAPDHRLEDGIEAARSMLARCFFDRNKCDRGIQALRQYRRERQQKLEKGQGDEIPKYRNHPLHDWTSHAADAFRYGAVFSPRKKLPPVKYPKLPIV